MNNTLLVIGREYRERVRRKSFLITTILMPLLMIGLMGMPTLMMLTSGPEEKNIAVVDHSGVVAGALDSDEGLRFTAVSAPLDSVKADEAWDAVLVVGEDVVLNPANVQMYTRESSSLQTEGAIRSRLERIIEDQRLKSYNIPDLDKIIASVSADVTMQTFTIDENGEEGRATSSMVAYIMGLVMMMMLYMFIIMYGQMVMTSIIEEKNNRVLEVVVGSVRPMHLMLGKLLGIGAVALTQIAIWAVLILSFTAWGLPALVASIGVSPETAQDTDFIAMMGTLGNPSYVMGLFGWLALFLAGGYLFYSALYAAIGSSVDNVQDASQLQMIALAPVLLGLLLSMQVIQDPNSSTAVWASIVPFTSPMVMMTRLPFGVPVWQTLTSLAVLAVSVWLVVWLAAKVYRVGIFMYGKKPTVRDLWRWMRQS